MGFVIRNIKRFYRLFLASKFVNWRLYFTIRKRLEVEVVVFYPGLFGGFFKNEFEHALILLSCVQKFYPQVKLLDFQHRHRLKNGIIFYNPSELFCANGISNYTGWLALELEKLEELGNTLVPTVYDLLHWENKVYMYKSLMSKNINIPETSFFSTGGELSFVESLNFPCLVKEPHSHASKGVHLINDEQAFRNLICSKSFIERNDEIVVQKLLNIRSDFRLIFIGNEIVLHYWRKNSSNEWKPTSTSHGSRVDFTTFPEKWRDYLVEINGRLGLYTAAYDIAWENDDFDSEPIILEVSPYYQPNPNIDTSKMNLTYGEYKRKLLFRNSWDKNYLNLVRELRQKFVNLCITKMKK